jgi:hypothetical protein
LEEDREEEAEALNSHLTGAKGWRTTIETGSFGLIFKNEFNFFLFNVSMLKQASRKL